MNDFDTSKFVELYKSEYKYWDEYTKKNNYDDVINTYVMIFNKLIKINREFNLVIGLLDLKINDIISSDKEAAAAVTAYLMMSED